MKKNPFNLNSIFKFAKILKEDDSIIKDGLVITYNLEPKTHKSINEELHYRIKDSKDTLEYGEVIEVKISEIDFILKVKEDE